MNRYLAHGIFVLLAITMIAGFFYLAPDPVPVGVSMEAAPASELKQEKTSALQIDFIKVFEPSTKQKLQLPTAIQQDKKKHVVASSKTAGDDHPHTITTVVDSETGEFSTFDRKDPLPWVAVRNTTHIAAYYGVKNGSEAIRLQAQQEFLSVKAVRVEATASVDIGAGKPDTFLGIGARISF